MIHWPKWLVGDAPTEESTDIDEWSRDDRYERAKRMALLRSGEMLEDEERPGVSAVHWAPLPPRATNAPPSEPGWYALRKRGTLHWSIVEVVTDAGGVLWWAYGPREPARRVATDSSFEWGDKPYRVPG